LIALIEAEKDEAKAQSCENAPLEKSRNSLQTGGRVKPLFMLGCDGSRQC